MRKGEKEVRERWRKRERYSESKRESVREGGGGGIRTVSEKGYAEMREERERRVKLMSLFSEENKVKQTIFLQAHCIHVYAITYLSVFSHTLSV